MFLQGLTVAADLPIAALSVDTQCETLIVTDREGNPLRPAIVWVDNRAAAEAEEIERVFGRRRVYEITGQPEVTATWPACKLLWIQRHEPEIWSRVKRIFLLEDWLLYRMTGAFATQKTLQSSSLYFDIQKEDWWPEMLKYLGIRREMLPTLMGSGERVGSFRGAAVTTSAIDQLAGAIGAGAAGREIISETTGTTLAVYLRQKGMPGYDPDKIVPCHKDIDGGFCLLPWTATAGMALKWFREAFCEGMGFDRLDALAGEVPKGSGGLTMLPYLCGASMPRYNPDARGVFYGIGLEHKRGHFARCIMESVACMLRQNLEAFGGQFDEIRSQGGGAESPAMVSNQGGRHRGAAGDTQAEEHSVHGLCDFGGSGLRMPAGCKERLGGLGGARGQIPSPGRL